MTEDLKTEPKQCWTPEDTEYLRKIGITLLPYKSSVSFKDSDLWYRVLGAGIVLGLFAGMVWFFWFLRDTL
jgi:hypothetical protein